ncbi:glycosyltransferase [Neptuniibacter sp. CAU 1671]|uniref:glycosyltransferase n=1 Tax=Neptuniibacter sp. CAU 1671 TaxID=3032593 RepID=UPI0023DBBC96|nr:glycosyltransferase [Neptuniibacter sp. CAU 1671]MDF2181398.1 glycosyltransferase [Neptuniibacter sp. CAU 1671]
MRILLVVGSFPPDHCGVGDYSEQLAIALSARNDAQVGVLTSKVNGRVKSADYEVLDPVDNWSVFEVFKIIRVIMDWKPDLVHFQYPSQGFFNKFVPFVLPIILRIKGLGVIQTWHEPISVRKFFIFLLKIIGASGLVFVRPNYMDLVAKPYRKLINFFPVKIILNASSIPVSMLDSLQRKKKRDSYLCGRNRLVVFFGFIYEHKGIEKIFEVADPETDVLIIAGSLKDNNYLNLLKEFALERGWAEHNFKYLGYLSTSDAADLLAVADAVVLPFVNGGGSWNTSIHGAQTQGTLVITTSCSPIGYDPRFNIYTVDPSDINGMKSALNELSGRRIPPTLPAEKWSQIADQHIEFYRSCIKNLRKHNAVSCE